MENKDKLIILVLSIILFLLIGAVGVSAFFKLSEINPAKRVLENVSNVKTLSYSALIKATLNSSDPKDADINGDMDLSISGDMDLSDENVPKGNMSIGFKSNVANNSIPSLSYDMVYNSKDVSYLKIKDISFPALDLSTIKDQWIKVDFKALGSLLGSSDIDPTALDLAFSKQQEKQLEDLFVKSNILKFIGKDSGQKINNVDMDYYEFSVNEDNFIKFIVDADNIINAGKGTIKLEDLKSFFNEIDFNKVGVWIGKSDYLPYKLSINMKAKGGYINFDMNFSNFNKAVKIEIPSESKTLEDVMTEILMSSYGSSVSGEKTLK